MAAEPTVDINHTPYYRATRSRRGDSWPASSSPRRVALFLFPFSEPRVSARVSPRVAASTCFLLVSPSLIDDRARTRGSHANSRALFLRRQNVEISRWRERSRDRVESTQRLRPSRITMAEVVKRLDTSSEGERIHDCDA